MSRRNDGKAERRPYDPLRRKRTEPRAEGWIWGRHAVEAALANPRRTALRRLLSVDGRAWTTRMQTERISANELERLLPAGATHQGVALLADPPEPTPLAELAETASGVLVMLDQVTDPQNVGAIFRSAAAFGACGLILQDRNSPPLTAALAKAAAGAIDAVPHARVVNLSRALETLEDAGWRAVGLAGEADGDLQTVLNARPTVLVLGSEGEGLRRLVREHCDAVARIPMPGGFESLNVSAAAAIALYETARAQGKQSAGEKD